MMTWLTTMKDKLVKLWMEDKIATGMVFALGFLAHWMLHH